jgi:hypothetical protein
MSHLGVEQDYRGVFGSHRRVKTVPVHDPHPQALRTRLCDIHHRGMQTHREREREREAAA